MLEKVYSEATEAVYPYIGNNDTCFMMLLVNLAEVDWIQVDCDKKLLPNALCIMTAVNSEKDKEHEVLFINDRLSCIRTQILKNNLCYLFLWYNGMDGKSMEHSCKSNNAFSPNLQNITMFEYLFDAVTVNFPPILSTHQAIDSIYKFTYRRYENIYVYDQEQILSKKAAGLHLCLSEKYPISTGDNLFNCKNGSSVSYMLICNGVVDCPFDNSDEIMNCSLFTNPQNRMRKFLRCSALFYMENDKSCIPFFPKIENNFKILNNNFLHSNDDLINDLVADFGPNAEDEPQLLSILTSPNMMFCSLPYEMPCIEGHPKCYNISDICKYTLSEKNHLVPCRNGNHLQNCREFECNSMFKCTNSYCIHYSYVNDEKWDCPNGEDENTSAVCSNMFKCKGSRLICINLNDVCDKVRHCPDADDELLCSLTNVKCLFQCVCLGLAISCKNQEIHLFTLAEYPYVSVNLNRVYKFELTAIKNKFPHAIFGIFLSNNVVHICQIHLPFTMIHVNLGFNHISVLYQSCFRYSLNLKFILLENNLITHIQHFAFWPLSNVSVINLSNNPIVIIAKHIIPFVHAIVFSMKNSTPLNVNKNSFLYSNIRVIDVSDFHICYLAPIETICLTNRPWYIRSDSLLPKSILQYIYHTVLGIVLFVNFIFFVVHNWARKVQNTAFQTIVLWLNINNIFCVIYLCFIGIADLMFQNNYIINDISWRSSPMCFAAFNSILSFNILNQVFHIYISTSRLMVVIYPIKTKIKNCSFVIKCISYMYATVLLLTCSVTLIVKTTESMLPFKMCFPFINPTNSVNILYKIAWLISISQLLCLVIICVQNTLLLYYFQHSKQTAKRSISDVSIKKKSCHNTCHINRNSCCVLVTNKCCLHCNFNTSKLPSLFDILDDNSCGTPNFSRKSYCIYYYELKEINGC